MGNEQLWFATETQPNEHNTATMLTSIINLAWPRLCNSMQTEEQVTREAFNKIEEFSELHSDDSEHNAHSTNVKIHASMKGPAVSIPTYLRGSARLSFIPREPKSVNPFWLVFPRAIQFCVNIQLSTRTSCAFNKINSSILFCDWIRFLPERICFWSLLSMVYSLVIQHYQQCSQSA